LTSVLLLSAFALNGCGPNWQPVSVAEPRTLDEGTILEFHAKDQLVRLHGVKFDRDSLSGIPWLDHLSCDTCRVRFALADVSQPRTGNPGAGAWNIVIPVVTVFGLGTLLAILACGGGRCD
jgi:hypothetical protein